MFVVPAVLTGFMLAVPTLYGLFTVLFGGDKEIDTSPIPSTYAIIQSLVIGIIIPLLSSIAPI